MDYLTDEQFLTYVPQLDYVIKKESKFVLRLQKNAKELRIARLYKKNDNNRTCIAYGQHMNIYVALERLIKDYQQGKIHFNKLYGKKNGKYRKDDITLALKPHGVLDEIIYNNGDIKIYYENDYYKILTLEKIQVIIPEDIQKKVKETKTPVEWFDFKRKIRYKSFLNENNLITFEVIEKNPDNRDPYIYPVRRIGISKNTLKESLEDFLKCKPVEIFNIYKNNRNK